TQKDTLTERPAVSKDIDLTEDQRLKLKDWIPKGQWTNKKIVRKYHLDWIDKKTNDLKNLAIEELHRDYGIDDLSRTYSDRDLAKLWFDSHKSYPVDGLTLYLEKTGRQNQIAEFTTNTQYRSCVLTFCSVPSDARCP